MDRYNLGVDLTDRHVVHGAGDRPALRFEDSNGFQDSYTYRRLAVLSNRFAHALRRLGVTPGDRVFFRLPNHPAFYYGALGCAKAGAVFIPSSTLFKEKEIAYRLADSGAVIAVTTVELLPELEAVAASAPALREIVIVDQEGEPPVAAGRTGLSALLGQGRDQYVASNTAASDPAFIAYSSGTTGDPKGILHMQRYARSYDYLIRDWHGYRKGDVCACPAEIGWMLPVASTFLYSLRAGIETLLFRERGTRFRPEEWCRLLADHRVTRFVGTPTIYRMLLTVEGRQRFDLSALKSGTSAGEPLPADTLERAAAAFGFPPLDGIGMSECMVYAHGRLGEQPVPGSCGRVGEGLELALLDDDLQPVASGEPGVLCLRTASHPGMMKEYWRKPEETAEVFRGEWYWSGDMLRQQEDGLLFFEARADDVMNCSGYRISPFEVEGALVSHPAVLEAAAVESPDAMRGQVVKGFVTLRPGIEAGEQLERELIEHVRDALAPFKAPRRIEVVDALPKTQSGKIKRRLLRDREQQGAG